MDNGAETALRHGPAMLAALALTVLNDHQLMMQTSQIALIQRSFDLLAPAADATAAHFYRRLFALAPELRPLFLGDLRSQGRRLMEMIGAAVRLLDHPDALLPVLAQLGARHAGYGVRPGDYRRVGEALIATLDETLGDQFDAPTREAWAAMYALVSATMIAATDGGRCAA